jgi:hypothetical protein
MAVMPSNAVRRRAAPAAIKRSFGSSVSLTWLIPRLLRVLLIMPHHEAFATIRGHNEPCVAVARTQAAWKQAPSPCRPISHGIIAAALSCQAGKTGLGYQGRESSHGAVCRVGRVAQGNERVHPG